MTDLRIVSSSTSAAINLANDVDMIKYSTREMVANVLRVTRGAGRPDEILTAMQKIVDLVNKCYVSHGYLPIQEIPKAITTWDEHFSVYRFDPETRKMFMENGEQERMEAKRSVCRGALQVVASCLLDQKTQMSAGMDEIYTGIHQLDELKKFRRLRT